MTRRSDAPTPAQALTDFRFALLGGERLARLVYRIGVIGGALVTAFVVVVALAGGASGGAEGFFAGFGAAIYAIAYYLFVIALLRVVMEVAVVVFDGRVERSAASHDG